jgi:hypothetical protein
VRHSWTHWGYHPGWWLGFARVSLHHRPGRSDQQPLAQPPALGFLWSCPYIYVPTQDNTSSNFWRYNPLYHLRWLYKILKSTNLSPSKEFIQSVWWYLSIWYFSVLHRKVKSITINCARWKKKSYRWTAQLISLLLKQRCSFCPNRRTGSCSWLICRFACWKRQ